MWERSFFFAEASQIMSFLLILFTSFKLDWAATICKLLGLVTCLPHKDGGILLIVLPKDTTSIQTLNGNWCDGIMVRASASQSVDLGFISQSKSYQTNLENSIHSFPARHSAQKG